MIEIPEAKAISKSANHLLAGRSVLDVQVMNTPNRFCWINKDKNEIESLILNQSIDSIKQSGHYVRILFSNQIEIACAEDIVFKYILVENLTEKNQLVLILDNGYALEIKVKLYGFILIGSIDELKESQKYYQVAYDSIDVLDPRFTYEHFKKVTLFDSKKGSLKQALSTDQKIPGLGNGILQDILFDAKLKPDRKLSTISDDVYFKLYQSVIHKIDEMSLYNGRDLQTNLFGEKGNYQTIMNNNNIHCPVCNQLLVKTSYLGGKVIYCPSCQQ